VLALLIERLGARQSRIEQFLRLFKRALFGVLSLSRQH
jgi:hypothetical protein